MTVVTFRPGSSYGETHLSPLTLRRSGVVSYRFRFHESMPDGAKAKVLVGFADLYDGTRCMGGKPSTPERPCWSVRLKAQRRGRLVLLWAYAYHLDNPDPDDGENFMIGFVRLGAWAELTLQVIHRRFGKDRLRVWIGEDRLLDARPKFLRRGERIRWSLWRNGWRNPEASEWWYEYEDVHVRRRYG